MEYITELFTEINKRAKSNGVTDQEGWDGIVDEVIEQFRTTDGAIHDDEETEGMEEDLRARFSEYEETLTEGGF